MEAVVEEEEAPKFLFLSRGSHFADAAEIVYAVVAAAVDAVFVDLAVFFLNYQSKFHPCLSQRSS